MQLKNFIHFTIGKSLLNTAPGHPDSKRTYMMISSLKRIWFFPPGLPSWVFFQTRHLIPLKYPRAKPICFRSNINAVIGLSISRHLLIKPTSIARLASVPWLSHPQSNNCTNLTPFSTNFRANKILFAKLALLG